MGLYCVTKVVFGCIYSCSNEQKQYLLDVGIFSVLQSILDSYIFKPDVIAEVLCVVACLCDIREYTYVLCVLCEAGGGGEGWGRRGGMGVRGEGKG